MTDLVDIRDPAELGLVPERVEALLARARREVDAGLLPSCQLALGRHGQVAVSATFGAATEATRYVAFSATKAVVAGAIWQLLGEGSLDVTLPVAHYIPEFGGNGKQDVTVEQVLLHTSGFPRAPLGPPEWAERESRLQRFAEWRLNWEPGTRYEYHPTSAHWVLAELLARLDGVDDDHRRIVSRRIIDPLGLRAMRLGVPVDDQSDIAELDAVGDPPTPDELEAVFGVRELPETDVTTDSLLGLNEPDGRAVGLPGGGMVTSASDLALYYQALLHDPAGLWDPLVLSDVTATVRNRLPDPVRGIPANRALGVVVAGDDGHASLRGGFGKTASPRTFGHDGAAGQIAWADPDSGISFAYLTNGIDQNTIRVGRRSTALGSLAGLCATPLDD